MMNDGAGGSYGDGSSYQGTARVGACTRPTKLGGSPWRLSKGEAGVSAASGIVCLCWTMQATQVECCLVSRVLGYRHSPFTHAWTLG